MTDDELPPDDYQSKKRDALPDLGGNHVRKRSKEDDDETPNDNNDDRPSSS